MKTIVLTKVLLLTVAMAFADGFVTKTNQSAQYARMLSRNASTGIDVAYFNPGGLSKPARLYVQQLQLRGKRTGEPIINT